MSNDIDEKDAILALLKIPQIGSVRFFRLLKRAGTIKNLWLKDDYSLFQDILPRHILKKLEKGPELKAIKELKNKLNKLSIWTLFFDDKHYPPLLKNIYNPPPILFGKGKKEFLLKDCIAIVGSRKASSYGVRVARQLAKELSEAGFVIVSGLALGIDTAAHKGALDAGGITIAVKGCGLDVNYPVRNMALLKQIEEEGTVISEFFPGVPPEPGNFPSRNRIISGLSKAVIVVEAGQKSGSIITAKLALEQGKEVMAVPGSIYSQMSKGCHELIKQGAILVESATDVLNALGFSQEKDFNTTINNQQKILLNEDMLKVVDNLEAEPQHIDEIAHKCHMPVSKVGAILLELELMDIAISQGAGRYSLINPNVSRFL